MAPRNPHAVDREWFDTARPVPCAHYNGRTGKYCRAKPCRYYMQGWRCPRHAPRPDPAPRPGGPPGVEDSGIGM